MFSLLLLGFLSVKSFYSLQTERQTVLKPHNLENSLERKLNQ